MLKIQKIDLKKQGMIMKIFIILLTLLLFGCGDTTIINYNYSNNDNNSTVKEEEDIKNRKVERTISGKIIDGYLQYSMVCLDINQDNNCQTDIEPNSISQKDGSFDLLISLEKEELKEYQLLVYGGYDVSTYQEFKYLLTYPKTEENNISITPISRILNSYMKKSGYTLDTAKNKIADLLNINLEKLLLDPILELKRGETKLFIKNLQVQIIKELEATDYIAKIEGSNLLEEIVSDEVKIVLKNIEKIVTASDFTVYKKGEIQSVLSIQKMVKRLENGNEIDNFNEYFINENELAYANVKNIFDSFKYLPKSKEIQLLLALEEFYIGITIEELKDLLLKYHILEKLTTKIDTRVTTNELLVEEKQHFKNLKFYGFNMKLFKNKLQFNLNKIDIDRQSILYSYFDFKQGKYELNKEDSLIFVNGERTLVENITYSFDNQMIKALFNDKNLFELSLIKSEPFTANRLDEYDSDINIKGTKYLFIQRYLTNFYEVEELASKKSFDTISQFIAIHREEPFIEKVSSGLVFDDGNKQLLELNNGRYLNAGYYEVKNINNKEIIFLYPNDLKSYPPNICYILDFNQIWKAQCYIKGSRRSNILYDENVYTSILEYLNKNFATVQLGI